MLGRCLRCFSGSVGSAAIGCAAVGVGRSVFASLGLFEHGLDYLLAYELLVLGVVVHDVVGFAVGFSVGCQYLFGARHPGAFAKYALHILGIYHLAVDEQLCQLLVAFLVFVEYLLCAFVLLGNEFFYFLVDEFCGVVAVWFRE